MPDAVSDTDSEVSSGMSIPLQALQIEGGDVIIRLAADEALVLDSKTLSTASPRFKARFSGQWGRIGTKKAIHPSTKAEISVYKYRMVWASGSRIMTDEDSLQEENEPGKPIFSNDDYSTGWPEDHGLYVPGRYDTFSYTGPEIISILEEDAAFEHKALFALLYHKPVEFTLDTFNEPLSKQTMRYHICNIIAYAEFYDMLPAIAAQMEKLLLSLPGHAEAIAETPKLYVALGTKLRSAPVFDEAIRHCVAQNLKYTDLKFVLSTEQACAAILPPRSCLQARRNALVKRLYSILEPKSLVSHGPHSTHHIGYSKDWEKLHCQEIAECTVREWLDISPNSASPYQFEPDQEPLHAACKAIIDSFKKRCALYFIGKNILRKYEYFVSHSTVDEPRDERKIQVWRSRVKALVYQMAKAIREHFPQFGGEKKGQEYECEEFDEHAEHQEAEYKDVKYFTYMAVNSEKPWSREVQWETFGSTLEEIKEASVEWLEAVRD